MIMLNLKEGIEWVTPNYESHPKRSYLRAGARIECFTIVGDSGGAMNRKLTLSDDPVFTLLLPSEDAAKELMNDLYYGEYTGA